MFLYVFRDSIAKMKKAFFVPLIFLISLLAAGLALACLFELYFLTNGTYSFTFKQFCNLLLQFFPIAILVATLLSFTYALKKEANAVISALLLGVMLVACIFGFYFIFSKSTNKNFILDGFNFSNMRGKTSFLQAFFDQANAFFNDWIVFAQTDLKTFILFSTSFWLAIVSFFMVSINCTNWKLVNFILMLTLTLASFYFYPSLNSLKFQIIFIAEDSNGLNIFSTPIIFYTISFFMFLIFILRFTVKKHREKKRSVF